MDRRRLLATIALGLIAAASLVAIAWPDLPSATANRTGQRAGVVLRQLDDPAASPEVGRAVPDFEWAMPDGTVRRLEDLRGRVVVLNFWATWCEPCLQEMPALDRAAGDPGVVVLALGIDEEPAKVDAFFERLAITRVEPLLDIASKTARRYAVVGVPSTFFVGPDGMLRYVERNAVTDATLRDALAKAR